MRDAVSAMKDFPKMGTRHYFTDEGIVGSLAKGRKVVKGSLKSSGDEWKERSGGGISSGSHVGEANNTSACQKSRFPIKSATLIQRLQGGNEKPGSPERHGLRVKKRREARRAHPKKFPEKCRG